MFLLTSFLLVGRTFQGEAIAFQQDRLCGPNRNVHLDGRLACRRIYEMPSRQIDGTRRRRSTARPLLTAKESSASETTPLEAKGSWNKLVPESESFVPPVDYIDGNITAELMPNLIDEMATEDTSDEDVANSTETIELYAVLGLTFLVATLSALDRVAMSVAILPLSSEFCLSETAKGQISSAFSVGYGLGIIPAGLIVANTSPRTVLAIGVALWSFATIMTPIVTSFITLSQETGLDGVSSTITNTGPVVSNLILPLLALRAVMGAAESVVLPATQRILIQRVSASNKSLAVAALFCGFHLGTILAYSASPTVVDELGWRGMFYLYGIAGIAWLVPWYTLTKDVPSVSSDTDSSIDSLSIIDEIVDSISPQSLDEERKKYLVLPATQMETVIGGAMSTLRNAPWKQFIASPGVLAMTAAHAANNWGLYNNLAWAPTFYSEQYGLNVRDSALLAVLPSVAGAVGGLFAGTVADKVINLGWNRCLVRKIFQGISLLGPAACLLGLAHEIPSTPLSAQLLLTGTVGLQAFNAAGYGASPQEKSGEKWAGLLYSVTSLPGVFVGSCAVYATGRILDYSGQDWSIVFGLNALINIVGVLPFLAYYDSREEFD